MGLSKKESEGNTLLSQIQGNFSYKEMSCEDKVKSLERVLTRYMERAHYHSVENESLRKQHQIDIDTIKALEEFRWMYDESGK